VSRISSFLQTYGNKKCLVRQNYENLLKRLDRVPRSESNRLPLFKNLPPPLCRTDYKNVKFWIEKSYEEHLKHDDGNTSGHGLVIKKPKRGRPFKFNSSEDDDEKHPYLEDEDGIPVDRQRVSKFNDRARKIFNTLKHADLAPASWGQLGLEAHEYFKGEMMSEFKEFRLCEGSWKLDRLASRVYASWKQNIRKNENENENEMGMHSRKKKKRSISPNPMNDASSINMDDSDVGTSRTPESALLIADASIVTVSLTNGPAVNGTMGSAPVTGQLGLTAQSTSVLVTVTPTTYGRTSTTGASICSTIPAQATDGAVSSASSLPLAPGSSLDGIRPSKNAKMAAVVGTGLTAKYHWQFHTGCRADLLKQELCDEALAQDKSRRL
jgi:hypothetical protein